MGIKSCIPYNDRDGIRSIIPTDKVKLKMGIKGITPLTELNIYIRNITQYSQMGINGCNPYNDRDRY